MRDRKLLTLAEPVVELSVHYPGRWAQQPDRSFVPANAPNLALNQATDNFTRQIEFNKKVLDSVKELNRNLNFFEWVAVLSGILALGLLILVVFRY